MHNDFWKDRVMHLHLDMHVAILAVVAGWHDCFDKAGSGQQHQLGMRIRHS